MLKLFLSEKYGINAIGIIPIETGAGSNTYKVITEKGSYILKNITRNEMNNPDEDPKIAQFLIEHRIPTARFIRTLDNAYLCNYQGGDCHMQECVPGVTLELNSAPEWFMRDSAILLGRIHRELKSYRPLPVGIGEAFFIRMTPENAKISYEKSLKTAQSYGDSQIAADLSYRLTQIARLKTISLNINQFTRGNTHGDYFISQIICNQDSIAAVIDWTCAATHPLCWEIIRSFTYASPSCISGEICFEELKKYVGNYLSCHTLTEYDLRMMPYLLYYQIGVCDYYNQYYHSTTKNRHIFLNQAAFATKLMRWFEKNVETLSSQLSAM